MSQTQKAKTDLTAAPQVKTANELMMNLETEIEAIKAGDLPIDKARVVMQGRRQQIRVIEIALAATRLDQAMRPMTREYFTKTPALVEGGNGKPPDKAA